MYLWKDSYKELTYIYMQGFISRERLISGVHMYLWSDSCVRGNSYKEFTCIYGGSHIGRSHVSMEAFIYRKEFI